MYLGSEKIRRTSHLLMHHIVNIKEQIGKVPYSPTRRPIGLSEPIEIVEQRSPRHSKIVKCRQKQTWGIAWLLIMEVGFV